MTTLPLSTITVLQVAFTIDVYNFAHSLDLYRGYAAIVAGEEFPASEFEPQYCLATSRRANANYVYSEEDLLAKYSQHFKVKKKSCQQPLQSYKGITLYVDHSGRQEMEQMIVDFWSTSRITIRMKGV